MWTNRSGKREALFSLVVERAFRKYTRHFRLVTRLIERTINQHGQLLLLPDIELKDWWTSLMDAEAKVIGFYCDHGKQEQFHSEFKTDLDLERLPSGKFDTNDAILHLGMLAYNCLRLLGQLGLLGELAPIRHPAKRRRLRTVLQELMYRSVHVVHKARQWWLDLGKDSPVGQVFAFLKQRLVVQTAVAFGSSAPGQNRWFDCALTEGQGVVCQSPSQYGKWAKERAAEHGFKVNHKPFGAQN
uniref:transposase n=1 Tax=Methylosarcina fibrata TaxID=105972 RepID=UPI0003715161|nr:transposase [Methylosarcina fibrata]